MSNEEIISKYYQEAVAGLDEAILSSPILWHQHVKDLGRLSQAAYVVIVFHSQVFNGGLHQYFLNGYGQFGFMALDYLKVIGANKSAKILEIALQAVNPNGYSREDIVSKIGNRQVELINNFDDDLSDRLNLLDNEYYSLEDNPDEDYVILLGNYLKSG